MVNLDALLIELDVRNGQPTELRDSQPRVKENEDRIVVSAEMLIFLDEFQKFTLLLSGIASLVTESLTITDASSNPKGFLRIRSSSTAN